MPSGWPASSYEALLDEHDAPRGSSSRSRFSQNDHEAEAVVAAGGGVEEVVDKTGLRTPENAFRNIDAQVIVRALANDTKYPSNARPDDQRPRRLVPDSDLIRRGAVKEPLRSIATDYGVSQTTILRYFKRPEVSKQLRPYATTERSPPGRPTAGATPQLGNGRISRMDPLEARQVRVRRLCPDASGLCHWFRLTSSRYVCWSGGRRGLLCVSGGGIKPSNKTLEWPRAQAAKIGRLDEAAVAL